MTSIDEKRDQFPNAAPNPQPFQFGLKGLLGIVTVVGMLAAAAHLDGLTGFVLAAWGLSIAGWILARITARRRLGDLFSRVSVYGLFVVVLVLMLPTVHISPPGGSGRQALCVNNLKILGLALLNYEERNGSFLPQCTLDKNGNPLISWRASMLSNIEQPIISSEYQLSEPWDSSTNKPLSERPIDIFRCPSDYGALDHPGQTSYVAIVGPGTMWKIGQGVKRLDIKDRLFDTLLLVEMKDSGIAWSEPRDLDLNHLPQGLTQQNLLQSLSNHAGGFNAVFADGHVEFIPSTIPWPQFIALTTIDGGETIDRSTW